MFGSRSVRLSGAVAAFALALLTVSWLDQPVGRGTLSAAEAPPVGDLRQLSRAFIDVAKDARPCVVNISTERKPKLTERETMTPPKRRPSPSEQDPFEDWFDRFFRDVPRSTPRQQSMGSGIIYSADGYIVTNEHVVDNADDIKVNLSDGRTFEAKIKGVDKKSDLAVLKIDAKGLPAARLGDSDKLQVGEIVIAIGSPFGLNETVTTGIVSAKGRYGMGIEDYENFIQTDAAINPGNSGGPLLNLDGEVIGINTAIFSRSGAYQGVGFAIPVNMVKNVAGQLIDKGEVTRGWLGVSIQNVTPELAKQFDIAEDAKGVVVSDAEFDAIKIKRNDFHGDWNYSLRPEQ